MIFVGKRLSLPPKEQQGFFLDSAITEEIQYALDYRGIDGVTTNPRHVQVSDKPFVGLGKFQAFWDDTPYE